MNNILHLICDCEGELFADTAGRDFTPHVINVYPGEVMHSTFYSFINSEVDKFYLTSEAILFYLFMF